MNKLDWQSENTISINSCELACSNELYDNAFQDKLIRKDSTIKHFAKTICWPILSMQKKLLIDGFIYRTIAKWAKKLINTETVFLEVGCGNMEFNNFLPKQTCYNAFDISLSEFHVKRLAKIRKNFNIALASATDIPLNASSANLIVSCEVFEHVPKLKQAINEIHRIAMPNAILLCSIPNNYCYKYQQKGPHSDHVNNFTYQEFVDFMESKGFLLQKGLMKGWWVPLPGWLTKTSYQLPISPRNEFYCTSFIYQFETKK